MAKSGIYQIRNIVNNKCYVGSAVDFFKRFAGHKNSLMRQDHHSRYLQRAWDKYGEENFVFEVIEKVLDKTQLIEREQHYLDTLNPEYSVRKKCVTSPLGIKRTKETKLRMSVSQIGKTLSAEHRKKMSVSHKGCTPWNKGKVGIYSEETKEKMRIAAKGNKNALKGKIDG